MTQVLTVLTKNYVLVACDRRLTFLNGGATPTVAHDNTCKLVSLCGVWGIAYTGLAVLNHRPTHEWIAWELAERNCGSPYVAARVLAERAPAALAAARLQLEQTFIVAGWARFQDGSLVPHFLIVSNAFGADGQRRSVPATDFVILERMLKPEELYAPQVIGQPLPANRAQHLHRLFRRILTRELSPRIPMRALAREISNTATINKTVGENVLAFCIPRAAAQKTYQNGASTILAKEPDLISPSFCYFDPEVKEAKQYGPTVVCGESAFTDFETENDPSRSYQSSSVRVLHMPKQR
jgi:hypothetical protein